MEQSVILLVWVISIVTSQDFSRDDYILNQMLFGSESNYTKLIRPSRQVNVNIAFTLHILKDLDTQTQSMTTAGWLILKWEDSRLRWNPSEYGNIDYIFDSDRIWRPEIIIRNAVGTFAVLKETSFLLNIDYKGIVSWEPPGLFVTFCQLEVTQYPYDRQKCSIEISSWSYSTLEVNLFHIADNIILDDYHPNGEWHLRSTSVSKTVFLDGKRSIPQLDFTLHMERRVSFYSIKVLLPVILLSLLSVMTFILPYESGEKVTYALTVVLAYTFVMLDVLQNMPPTSIDTSILGLYLASILFLGCSATAMAIVNLSMYYHMRLRPTGKARAFIVHVLVPISNWRRLDLELNKHIEPPPKTELLPKREPAKRALTPLHEVTGHDNKRPSIDKRDSIPVAHTSISPKRVLTPLLEAAENKRHSIKRDSILANSIIPVEDVTTVPEEEVTTVPVEGIRLTRTQMLRSNKINDNIRLLALNDLSSSKTHILSSNDGHLPTRKRMRDPDKCSVLNVMLQNVTTQDVTKPVVLDDFYTWKEIALMCDIACFRIFSVIVLSIGIFYQITCRIMITNYDEHDHDNSH